MDADVGNALRRRSASRWGSELRLELDRVQRLGPLVHAEVRDGPGRPRRTAEPGRDKDGEASLTGQHAPRRYGGPDELALEPVRHSRAPWRRPGSTSPT